MSTTNRLKRTLAAGGRAMGCWIQTPSADVVEILAHSGLDLLLIDHEHGTGLVGDAINQMRAMKGTNATSMVRVPSNDPAYFKRILDAGAECVMCPSVQSSEEAQAVVDACFHPPRGSRGAGGGTRAAVYGYNPSYTSTLEENLLIAVQIETAEAVEQIEAIGKVPGVDMIFIGPRDLSASINKLAQFQDPAVLALVAEAERRIRATGKFMGSVLYPGQTAKQMYERGYQLIIGGGDVSFLMNGARDLITAKG